MPEIATKFTVHPADSQTDQTLIAGVDGYRYRIIEWMFNPSGSNGDLALYFGLNKTVGRFIAAGHVVSGGIGWAPRFQVGSSVTTLAGISMNPYPTELWTGYEGESIGLFASSNLSWLGVSFLTYEKIPVVN